MILSSKRDPILEDIKRSVKEGFFDKRMQADYEPSELETTSVQDLLKKVSLMSDRERHRYLGEIGDLPRERGTSLSGSKRGKHKKKKWLTRK
jgi:hypothetical protein